MKRIFWISVLLIQGTILASDCRLGADRTCDGVLDRVRHSFLLPLHGYASQNGRLRSASAIPPRSSQRHALPVRLVVESRSLHERVLCFDRTGKQVWKASTTHTPPELVFQCGPVRVSRSTPIIHDAPGVRDRHVLLAHVPRCPSGTVVWKRDLLTDYQLPPSSLDASPRVDGNLLIVPMAENPKQVVASIC